jgi:hypothetical protein
MFGKNMPENSGQLPSNLEVQQSMILTDLAYKTKNPYIRYEAHKAAMETPNFLPFKDEVFKHRMINATDEQYYTTNYKGITEVYKKRGRYYDQMTNMGENQYNPNEKDLLIARKIAGANFFKRGKLATETDYEKIMKRILTKSTPLMKGGGMSATFGFGSLGDTYSILTQMEQEASGGVRYVYPKFAPRDRPDYIYIDAKAGTGQFGDEEINNAVKDSIQEWNYRSPRRGGEVFGGNLE